MTNKWDLRFLKRAKEISDWSKDPSTKVGAVIVRPDRTEAGSGYNGFPALMEDRPELYEDRMEKYSRIIHGEVNALLHCRERVRGFTLYTWPFAPCERCAVIMLQAGIFRFIFPQPTADVMVRWAVAFNKTKQYIFECGRSWDEVPREDIDFE